MTHHIFFAMNKSEDCLQNDKQNRLVPRSCSFHRGFNFKSVPIDYVTKDV